MNIIWMNGKPFIEDADSNNGLRELTPYEMEMEGYHD